MGGRTRLTEQERYITPTEWSRYRLLEKMMDLARLPQDASCCEIGCGVGIFLSYLESKGLKALGVDISDEAIKVASGRLSPGAIRVRKGTAYEIREKFDAVFSFEVLEHVEDDARLIKYIYDNLLKEGGVLCLSVPAKKWLFSKQDAYYGHLRRYDKKELADKLKEAGFTPTVFWSYGLLPVHLICAHLLFRRFYSSAEPSSGADERTAKSGLLEFPAIWKVLYPMAARFYALVVFIEKAFLNFDAGYSYLVMCRKGARQAWSP
jgi:cyclopropane fatty-acyl-phospholipid synthase-like methyltransferase